ncbi:MAG: 1-acyl-sn-glycerol-3-phosphate acyltransferase [Desulfobacteraceae bacterium]|nr:1-acyl-sn-glycerol-3-phosphate acyltransferase [Desulfobacteraceae bacterium]MDH3575077.1 1-acyl-sn-glycerol-3-phosphate acyltransferase [Desulfobacteraceae bacterium]MDH3722481.1 1-acyl-sn-glycerol-3-phosphate acyltransferase [Desulfobacteraceae bacterium]MDH3837652.1 1-acyl-sn-glycerol-3-phosphate acyltransferase [Desulfobacteraceae bacterium]MDH3875463.1 1-acyl-sn-glycerol-3-phosphate acyltransferase [Desulfobacteraceae bacterium]
MTGQITISTWLFILLVIIAVLAVLDRILIPSTRWFLRRRINRVLDEIGTRLDIEIRPFQLTKRQVLIDRLVYDPKVVEEIQNHAQQHDMPLEVVQKKAVTYAREIVPSFNAYLYFRIGYWLAKKIARLLYRVRVGLIEDEQYLSIDPDSTVVFVMNHRSNMDYVLVAFLAAERTTLSYAVGEWAKIWPLQMLIRAMGAFFVRRNSGNPLYRRVLERYIHMATREGVCQAVFLEGGLSRDGRLQKPKLGLIDYMLRRFDPATDRDVVFIPVGINYDRTIEDRSLLRTFDPAAEKRSWWFVCRTTFKFIRRSLVLMILSRWRRYGYACVNFGKPLSAKAYCLDQGLNFSRLPRTDRFPEIEKLCHRLMAAISEVVPILPVSLMSTVFLEAMDTELDILDIEERSNRLINKLQACGAPVFEMSRSTRAHDIVDAIDLMMLRRIVTASGDQFKAVSSEEAIMRYYANTIDHWRQHE